MSSPETAPLSSNNGDSSLNGEEIVISGISGIFPSSENVNKFMENLYNKVDMVVAVEPPWNLVEMPKHQGKVDGLDKFDAQFFKFTFNHAKSSDPMIRKLMEQAYGAVFDAGFNPLEFDGSNLGVFIGSQYMDMVNVCLYADSNTNKFFLSGCSKTMMANRISYWLNGKAQSFATDHSCVSSLASLEQAYQSIKSGQCNAALVGGSNICLLPGLSVNLARSGMLCLDGKTKCFDRHADGYVRSEGISVILLQKAKDARRIYSEVYHAKLSYGLKQGDKFMPTRKIDDLTQFYKDFYTDINVSPEEVEYVEANGTAIAEADANEMEAIGNFFGKKSPVLIGSVKSNMGHSEAVSGLSAVTKACLAYHTGKLPANLHFTEPLDISSIREKRLDIVVDNVPFKRGFVAINNFSYTGVDAHVLLRGHFKAKDKKRYVYSLPYLLTLSGRQEDCVEKVIKQLEKEPIDAELIALLHKIHEKSTSNHMGRGYVILDTNEDGETIGLARSISYFSGETRPICFMYSGMGSQWSGMGAELMRIPIFKNAIMKCHRVLKPKGIDIVKVITDTDKSIFDNILNCFIGISAVQIGLTDILKELGIVPDIIFGHSHGETGCAYADGCFTLEETILTSYCRGLTSLETDFIPGAMAAVGLGFKDIIGLVPPEIDVACHNSSESSTISGPAGDIAKFVEVLKSRGIFAKEVQSCGISYHSRYTAVAGPRLLKDLKNIITNPKPRSDKWLCTSSPKDRWQEPIAKFSSAEYHVNNLLSPVYFEEVCQLIPPNALIIEIAPHGLLQAILKRSLPESLNIPLTKRGTPDPVKFILQGLGKIYESGYDPNVARLYPKVEFPVSTETPLLSHFVHWDHSETWPVIQSAGIKMVTTGSRELVMSIHDDDYDFIKGHIRNGVYVLPESFLLFLVWETLAMSTGINYSRLPVEFNDIKFHNEVIVDPENSLKLFININRTGNRFEVSCRENILVSGLISLFGEQINDLSDTVNINDLKMCGQDIYKILHRRGHFYKTNFQTIFSMSIDCTQGTIRWADEWPLFIDALIQFNTLVADAKCILRPKFIQELIIDVHKHRTCKRNIYENTVCFNAKHDKVLGVTRCGGVKIKNIVFENIAIPQRDPDVLTSKEFCTHFPTINHDLPSAINILMQVVTENITKECLKVIQVAPSASFEVSLLDCIQSVVTKTSANIKFDCQEIDKQHKEKNIIDGELYKTTDVLVVYNLLQNKQKMMEIHNQLQSNAFLLTLENAENMDTVRQKHFNVISAIRINSENIMILLKKRNDYETYGGVTCIKIDNYYKFSWLKKVHSDLGSKKKVILLSVNQPLNGITGIVTFLSKKYGNRISLVKIEDINAPIFDQENIFYKEQLEKHLVINVLREGQWGSYYKIPKKVCTERKNYALDIECPGDFSSLKWSEILTIPTHRTVKVHYAGLSLRDVREVNGKDTTDGRKFGMDFSGIDINGNRVMGVTLKGSVANTINVDSDLIWPVPDYWTLKEAATVPLAYVHAYYCLAIRATLYKGASVIVTGGAGALGQAVISICLAYGHNVLTTVSDIEKKKLLLKLYPKLKDNQIYSSKDKNTAALILTNLENRRHNLIINCESGMIRKELMACVGFSGHFLDITKEDAEENENIGMGYLFGAKNYKAVDLSNIFKPENTWERNELQLIIAEGISRGIVKPLPSVEYTTEEIPRAFKFLSSRKHRGKVLINLQTPINRSLKYSPRITCSSDKSYIVFGDSKELALEIIDFLVHRNVKNIILHLKNKKLSGYGEFKLQSWVKQNVRLKLVYDDILTDEGCCNIFNETTQMGPIEGIFVIRDHIEENSLIEDDDFSNSFTRLVSGIVKIEATSRESTLDILRYFSIISRSTHNVFEEYINSVCEDICRARNAIGLPGLLFNVIGLNEFPNMKNDLNSMLRPQDINTFYNGLETSLTLKLNNAWTLNIKTERNNFMKPIEISDMPHFNGLSDASPPEMICEKTEQYKRLKMKNKETIKQKENFNGGFAAFFNFIDDDLYRATETFIPMSTKIVNTFPDEHELDPDGTYLMLIPGFEGHSRIFKSLCQRLKIKAFTIQLVSVEINESISEMAADILRLIKKRLILQNKFYLLGYSFGINIALELTNMLEVEGHVGVVYCLDSSPDVLRKQIDAYIGSQSNVQLQNSIIKHMFALVGKDVNNLSEHLNSKRDWYEKIDYFIQEVKKVVNYPHEYIRNLLNSVYERIILARNYNPTYKLNSEIILIRGIPHPDSGTLPYDYNLSKYTNNEIKIFEIESDTTMAPFDDSVPNIVNKLLDPSVIEAFKNSSSCEVYFMEKAGFNF